jgi:hypothetical protein
MSKNIESIEKITLLNKIMSKEVRRLKLELIIKDEPGLRKVINFLDHWFIGTRKEEREDITMYWKESDWVFYYYNHINNEKYRDYFINYDKIWSILETDFNYNFEDIEKIIAWYIERTHNLKPLSNINTVFKTFL